MKKLKIVVIGYYGKLNAGDDLLQNSIASIFRDHDLLFTSWFPGIDFLNLADLVVVGGGSIWPGNTFFQHARDIAKKLKTPLIILGISAKRSDPEVAKHTKHLADKAVFFHVRDERSKEIIGIDEVVVGADLYWWSEHFLPQNNCADVGEIALNLRAWKECSWDSRQIYRDIQEVAPSINPFPLFFGASVHDAAANLADNKVLEAVGCESVPASFDVGCLGSSSLMVGMRFHALMVAIRAGIPVIGFDYHNKTKTFFEENGMSELCIPLADGDVKGAISTVANSYAEYKKTVNAIRDRFLLSAETEKKRLLKIVAGIEPSHQRWPARIRRSIKRYF